MMPRIWKALSVELVKQLRRRFTYVAPLLIVFIVGLSLVASPLWHDRTASAYGFIAQSTQAALNLLGLLLLLLFSSSLMAGEVQEGTICMALVRPIRRVELFLAKLLLTFLYAMMLTAFTAFSAWFMAFLFGELNGVTYGGELSYTNLEMVQCYAIGALLALLPQWAAAAYALMISTFMRTTVSATGLAIGLWICTDFAKHTLGLVPYLFTSYMDKPWSVFEKRCDLISAAWMPDALYTAVTSILSIFLFTSVSIWVFTHRDMRS